MRSLAEVHAAYSEIQYLCRPVPSSSAPSTVAYSRVILAAVLVTIGQNEMMG